jgi:hypothetical protein
MSHSLFKLFKIAHPSAASVFCEGIVRLRIDPPMMALYCDIIVSTKLCLVSLLSMPHHRKRLRIPETAAVGQLVRR